MRLFIAIEFDEEILQALTNLQSEWKVLGVRGNFTPVQNLHLTLAFIGEYGNPNAVLEAMILENNALSNYVRRLRRALAENAIPYDRKRFSPHITLVRRAEFNGSMEELLKNPPKGAMEVKSVSIMSSTRGKNGMIYTKVGGVEAN